MLPLGSTDLPVNAATLAESITRGLAMLFDLGKASCSVEAGAAAWPAVDAIAIDLTGARAKFDRPDAPLASDARDEFEVSAGSIRLRGRPIKMDDASLTLDLSTIAARIRIWRDRSGRAFWAVASAGTGSIHLDFLTRDLEALLISRGRVLAADHGVTIKKIDLALRPINDRSLAVEATITAAKSFLSAGLHIGGTMSVDDQLNARLDNLTCRGDGMIGKATAALIRPKLEAADGQPIALASVLGPGIRLKDVKLSVTDRVAVDAKWE
jgi:hypothetical protein